MSAERNVAVIDRRYRWHHPCSHRRVAALVFLVIGLLCALIARVLLVTAAMKISGWWVVGVFVPFGPLVFRLKYPNESRRSFMFRLATLPCLFLYFLLGSGPLSPAYHRKHFGAKAAAVAKPASYALEKPVALKKKKTASGEPKVELTPNVDERRASNMRELERLRSWGEELRLRKRDLLRSDLEGNIVYNAELKQYNAALEKATAERNALWPSVK
jgi:hypothetical protein